MKKNFLAIASLLIAAMLLMVSCNQEVAPKNNLVEARLSVGYGRDLIVTGDTKTSNVILKYSMTQGWTDTTTGKTETVHGAATNVEFTDGGSIGYVTPGLWNIVVDAYETITTKNPETQKESTTYKKIFTGNASAYFSDQNNQVKVYLAPVTSTTNSVEFKVTMQNLVGSETGIDASGKDSYVLKYSLLKTGANQTANNGDILKAVDQNGVATGNTYYNTTVTGLESGFYRVTVSVYSKESGKEDKLVGGITKGFLLSNGANATVEGHIEPSDYEKVMIDAVYIDVKTGLTQEGEVVYSGDKGTEGRKAIVSLKYTDSTDKSTVDSIFTPTATWYYVDGNKEKSSVSLKTNTENVYEISFSKPGYKNISCQTIYTATYEDVVYTFADTQFVQVYVDASEF